MIITTLVTAAVYRPVSVVIYKIREPYFRCPVLLNGKGVAIRNDPKGNGLFGAKRRGPRQHAGIDISAPVGTAVRAAKSGIAFCGEIPSGYGKYVMIYHPDGLQTIYGHLSEWKVFSTQPVRQGDVIGFVGKTGNAANRSIQPHLHFEIREKGEPKDPLALTKW